MLALSTLKLGCLCRYATHERSRAGKHQRPAGYYPKLSRGVHRGHAYQLRQPLMPSIKNRHQVAATIGWLSITSRVRWNTKPKTDYISDFGPQKNVGAVRTTMAEEVTFDNFKTKGVYLGAGKEVTRSAAGAVTSGHQYIMGLKSTALCSTATRKVARP